MLPRMLLYFPGDESPTAPANTGIMYTVPASKCQTKASVKKTEVLAWHS